MLWIERCLFTFEGVVGFIQKHLGKEDVLRSLSNEILGNKVHQLQCSPSKQPLSEQLSGALQAEVTKCRMTWFEFGRYLLRSNLTRRFVFEIAKYTTSGESYRGGGHTSRLHWLVYFDSLPCRLYFFSVQGSVGRSSWKQLVSPGQCNGIAKGAY